MGKKIIGIHGLANKPTSDLLEKWWIKSIKEGLSKNCGLDDPEFDYRMVYWANRLYKYPLHVDEGFAFDKLYNDEPYMPAGELKEYKDSWSDDLRGFAGQTLGTGMDWFKQRFNVERVGDFILGSKLKDLDFYYSKMPIKGLDGNLQPSDEVLRGELKAALEAEKQHEIMLIAHSMGTIIAYDVLRELGQNNPQDWNITHFVTIGSPLGLPHVKKKIVDETRDGVVRTPSLITKSWVNFADRKDPVALDSHLNEDYKANALGIKVKDDLVSNDYTANEERNHHKSYGYLRTPEISKHIKAFLGA